MATCKMRKTKKNKVFDKINAEKIIKTNKWHFIDIEGKISACSGRAEFSCTFLKIKIGVNKQNIK